MDNLAFSVIMGLGSHTMSPAMSAPLYVSLTPSQRRELQALRRDPTLRPRERNRVECLLLSDRGLKVPALADHLDGCQATVRNWLHRFGAEGLAAVREQARGVRPDRERRRQIEAALDRLLQRRQVWSSAGLAAALAEEEDIHLKPRTVRKYLQGMGAGWRRTHATLRHKQDPEQAAAARVQLADFKKKPWLAPLTSFSWMKPASAPPCPPPTPGPGAACDRSSPTRTPGGGA